MTERGDHPILPVPPGCADLMDRLQLVLDGELSASVLEPDAHVASCRACRERMIAAKLMLKAVAKRKREYIYPFPMKLIFHLVRALPAGIYRWLGGKTIELSRPR